MTTTLLLTLILFFLSFFFFFNDTATPEIYTLSLHDALPIYRHRHDVGIGDRGQVDVPDAVGVFGGDGRSEEHTSELQSQSNLVCRLLLEKKKIKKKMMIHTKHKLTRHVASRYGQPRTVRPLH